MLLSQIQTVIRRPILRGPIGQLTGLSSSLLLLGSFGYDAVSQSARAISFNFSAPADTPPEVLTGFSAAGDLWSSVLQDDVTVNIGVSFADLETGVLGRTIANEQSFAYTTVRDALWSDRTSTIDDQAIQQIPQGSTFDLLINRTSSSPFGAGNPTPYLDNNGSSNNQTIRMTHANAKALGLLQPDPLATAAPVQDASIIMSRQAAWDFDRRDGIGPDALDFTSVATHEIGHALGFVSGTDLLDSSSSFTVGTQTFFLPEDYFAAVSPLDLFRVSEASVATGRQVIDWTASPSPKFFSLDGGQSVLAPFATGIVYGQGQSNSHWAKDQTNGIMDPDILMGEQLAISGLDLIALDAIGWDLRSSEATLSLFPIDGTQLAGAVDVSSGLAIAPHGGWGISAGASPISTGLASSSNPWSIAPIIETQPTDGFPIDSSITIPAGPLPGATPLGALAPLATSPLLAIAASSAQVGQQSATPGSYLNMAQAVPERSSWMALIPIAAVLALKGIWRKQSG
ncbi:MAG: NF038122 family metalloprotease [Elainellaceae cyanobacterium]